MLPQGQQAEFFSVIKQIFFKPEEYKLLAAVQHGFVNNKWSQNYLLSKTLKTGFVGKGKVTTKTDLLLKNSKLLNDPISSSDTQ